MSMWNILGLAVKTTLYVFAFKLLHSLVCCEGSDNIKHENRAYSNAILTRFLHCLICLITHYTE